MAARREAPGDDPGAAVRRVGEAVGSVRVVLNQVARQQEATASQFALLARQAREMGLRVNAGDRVVGSSDHARPTFERERALETARDRARELLFEHLDGRQREQFERTGTFDVSVEIPPEMPLDRAPSAHRRRALLFRRRRRTYTVTQKPSYNVLSEGYAFCVTFDRYGRRYRPVGDHPPVEDLMLALKLMLETDPIGFHRLACASRE